MDAVVKKEFREIHTSRLGLAKVKHEKIVVQQHVEAVNNLSKQETNKKIKGHILGVLNQRQEFRERLHLWKGLVVADTITKFYWKTAHGIAEAKRRALREKLAIGAMKRIIKENMNKRGANIEERNQNKPRWIFTASGFLASDVVEQRARKILKSFLIDS